MRNPAPHTYMIRCLNMFESEEEIVRVLVAFQATVYAVCMRGISYSTAK